MNNTVSDEGCESLTDIYTFTGTQAQALALNNGMNFTQIARVEVNGEEVKTLDVGKEVIMERTLVPVRAVSESIGADVKWDAERQTVVVTY